jgi:hypothetical protein
MQAEQIIEEIVTPFSQALCMEVEKLYTVNQVCTEEWQYSNHETLVIGKHPGRF